MRKPVTSGTTESRAPVEMVAMTGIAEAAASSTAFGNPSRQVGRTSISMAR